MLNAGAAAAKAEAAKINKCSAIAATYMFISFAFETLRAWGMQTQKFVGDLGERITGITGDVRETAFLRQRLSIALHRGNVISIRGTLNFLK